MSIFTALLIAIVTGFAYFSRRFMGDWYLERPIILGPVVGLIMGDLETGLIIGGTLELIFMGAANIGGAVPPNYTIGASLGTAFAISTGQDVEAALVIAIPAAVIGSLFEILAKTICSFFVGYAEKAIEKDNFGGISVAAHLGNATHFLSYAIPTFLALVLGSDAVNALVAAFPEWLQNGIKVAGGMLPALGFALLLSTLVTPLLFPFFFVGFLIAAYMNVTVLGVALFGILVAIIIQAHLKKSEESDYEMEVAATAESQYGDTISKKDLKTLFIRSFALQSAFSFDRMQAVGFTWGLMPFLKKIYAGNHEGLKAALKRHMVFFNTHPWDSAPIYVMAADLEARKARGEDIDEQSINGIKSSLMGPLAGVGDSLFHGTLRPVMGGVCAALALQGNPVAPILFFLTVNLVHVLSQWFLMKKSYQIGENALGLLASSKFKNVMEGAAMAGLMAVGALVATWLNIKTSLVYKVEDAAIEIQTMLDNILPKLLPLVVTLIVFWLIRKRFKPTNIMLVMIVIGVVLGGFKILGV